MLSDEGPDNSLRSVSVSDPLSVWAVDTDVMFMRQLNENSKESQKIESKTSKKEFWLFTLKKIQKLSEKLNTLHKALDKLILCPKTFEDMCYSLASTRVE